MAGLKARLFDLYLLQIFKEHLLALYFLGDVAVRNVVLSEFMILYMKEQVPLASVPKQWRAVFDLKVEDMFFICPKRVLMNYQTFSFLSYLPGPTQFAISSTSKGLSVVDPNFSTLTPFSFFSAITFSLQWPGPGTFSWYLVYRNSSCRQVKLLNP